MRFGESHGHSESHEELRGVDIGTLVLTNERIVFVGSKRTNSTPLEKLISVEAYANELVIHREGKQKIESYQLSSGTQIHYEYNGQTLAAPLDGRLIKLILDEARLLQQNAVARASVAVSNGDRLLAQSKLGEALKFYRDSFAIMQRSAKADPDNAGVQRYLSLSNDKIADVLKKQGNLDEALKYYRDSFAIRERLAKADPGNTDAEFNLSVSDDNIGEVLKEQGNLDGALKFYRDSFAIRERLAKADPGNTDALRGLLVCYAKIGDVFKEQSNFDEALKSYRQGLPIAERLGKVDGVLYKEECRWPVGKIGALSFKILQSRNFSEALDLADQAISLAPDLIWIYIIRAHALMFLGKVDEARAIYLQYRGHQKLLGEKSWEVIVLEDFTKLGKVGLTHPLMDEIEKDFSSKSENFPPKLPPTVAFGQPIQSRRDAIN